MKKIFLFFLISVSSIFLAACSVGKTQQTIEVQDKQIISITLGDIPLSVEAVISMESITKGLGERDSIGSDGMLFFMPEKNVANFWMHGMRFSLDFVWIADSKVVGIIKDVPAPQDPNSFDLPSYSSKVPVTHVLELPAGTIGQLNISEGMTFTIN